MNYFDYEYRVRYADTDKLGIAYYANYFVWFEAARTEYFREFGLPYTECEKKGYFLPVLEASAKYLGPCTYDDLVVVRTSVSEVRNSLMRFEYQVFLKDRPQKVLTTGFSAHVCVDRKMKPVRIPAEIREKVTLYK